ncbi:MAG: topoisomerase II, partial [Lachnospiraceae bacterium]|nr:topoisomerase II [Lachnospiraceae bacterium]
MRSPDITTEELLEIMPGPDFATGGLINASKEELINIYETGLGKLKVRGKVEIRELGYGRKSICVTEIPTTMIGSTANFLDNVAALVRNRELPAVVDIADRGDKNGECLCIDVKKGTSDEEIQNIINILYKKAGLEDTFGVNINCINDGRPEVMGLKRIFHLYSTFKKELYETKYTKLLEAEEDVKEIKSGLIEAVDCIDLIIEILRGAKNTQDAKACLMHGDTSKIKFRFEGSKMDAEQLCFTEKQADAILAMRLQRLIGLEVLALKKELAEAEKNIKRYTALLKDKKKMLAQMIADMEEIKNKHSVPRRTHIEKFAEVKIKKAEEVVKDVAVLLDRFFYVKVIDDSVYLKNEEQIKKDYRHSFVCGNTDRIAIFTDTGDMHTIKVADIIKQQAKKNVAKGKKDSGGLLGRLSDKGIQIFDFCNMEGSENIPYMCSIERNIDKMFIFVNSDGMAKRVEASQFDVSRKTISIAKNGETFVMVNTCEDSDFVICKSKDGYYLRVAVEEIPTRGRTAGGVKLMALSDGDVVEAAYSGSIKDSFPQGEQDIPFTKIKPAKRGAKGIKMRSF